MKLLLVLSAVATALHVAWSAAGWPAKPFMIGSEYIPEQLTATPSRAAPIHDFPEG